MNSDTLALHGRTQGAFHSLMPFESLPFQLSTLKGNKGPF